LKNSTRRDRIVAIESDYRDGDTLLVSYGSVSRSAKAALVKGRAAGLAIGLLRLKTIWPFAAKEIEAAAQKVQRVVVLENNTGQLFPYIKADAAAYCRVDFLGPQILGQIHDPDYILNYIQETA
jgi:2-oxoglutarate ferredoxin oxidoreductase subunit alpha